MIGRNFWALVVAALLLAALAGGIWFSNRPAASDSAEPGPIGAGPGPAQPRALAPVGLEIGSDEGPGPFQLAVGDRLSLLAAVELEDGSIRYDAPISWSSSDPQVARVDARGLLSGIGLGQVRVTAELSPLAAEVTVRVGQ